MNYRPINPISFPGLQDTFLGYRRTPFRLPQLSFLDEDLEYVVASAKEFDPENPTLAQSAGVIYTRTRNLVRLSQTPLKLRHNGSTADMELYIDNYSYVHADDFLQVNRPFPPPSPYNLLWSKDDYYIRNTTLYIYERIPVPPASSLVWDGRFSVCVNASGSRVDASNRLPKVRGLARRALESNSLTPTFTVGLAGLGNTQRFPPANINGNAYSIELDRWLKTHYNSDSIPAQPTTTTTIRDLQVRGSRLRPSTGRRGGANVEESYLAAQLNGDYFVRWTVLKRFYSRPD